ncbi:MAG: type I DNA topoisomerase [Patescibacteria group bacterium]|nr:type I DNA topoisomerase [Patescibacteria group bacterium]
MNNLVVVESPTKAKTIGKFLGNGYKIKASMGHVLDLPKSTLGVDVEHNFKPLYELIPDKSDVVQELQTLAKKVDLIILATDPDREGEAIAAHVKDLIKSKKDNIKRIVFHEITKEAVEEALNSPRSIDSHLVDAQTARRVLDRLVGYKLSPLLWRKVRRGLSAGRVQSVALRLIVEREKEIEKFKKEEYWTIFADLKKTGKDVIRFELIEINNEKIESQDRKSTYDGEYTISKTILGKEIQAKKIVDDLKKDQFVVSEVIQKEMKRSPQAPYTTSTLQQDAARRLGLNGRKTMSIAQKLYEEGYITYHRTDSVVMAVSAQKSIINFVKNEYGEKYLPENPRVYTAKQKLAQEAHEAIRPTKVITTVSTVTKDLGGIFGKLYEVIWQRAVASQMADAITESTTVLVDTTGSKDVYKLKANGSVLVFEGYLKVNPQALSDTKLPEFKAQEKLKLVSADKEFHETPPPPRYNDASLIKTLEEKGIGRPSTYASIVSTIESRRYIERTEGRFVPTTVGNAVNEFLVDNFSDIDDIPFTAQMEDELDEIADGKRDWEPMMKEFYKPFEKKLEKVKDAKRVKIEVEKTDEKCEKCGAPLVVRIGRFGKFLSCSKFPECDFTKPFIQETGFKCPKDGGNVIVRKTRKGRIFYGCSNYPKCDFATWKLEDLKNPQEKKEETKEKTKGKA